MKPWGTIVQQFSEGPYSLDVDQMWKLFFDRRRTENYNNGNFFTSVVADTRWLGPDVRNIEVNWEKAAADARGYADRQTASICYKLSSREFGTATSLRALLKAEYGSLESARYKFTERIQQNSSANSAALQKNVAHWEMAVSGLRGIRNASTTILAVGATVLTAGGAGGAALLFTGVGAGLTGTAKAQDTERHLTTQQAVGIALVSGSLDFVTTVVTGGIAKGAKLAEGGAAIVTFFVKVPTKTMTSILFAEMTRKPDEPAESLGVHAWEATKESFVEAAGGVVAAKLLKVPAVSNLLKKLVVVGGTAISNATGDWKEFGKEATKEGISQALQMTAEKIVKKGPPKDKLPEAVSRQPIHGGSGMEYHVLLAIMSPLSS
jgi:hypothetical protein